MEELYNPYNEKNIEISEENIKSILEKFNIFYKAEDYHQNYYALNKDKNPYCQVVSDKLYKMMKIYSTKLKK